MVLKLSICGLVIQECVSCYVMFFNATLIHDVVPSMFGVGIVPLLKGHNLDSSISDHCGIPLVFIFQNIGYVYLKST